MLLLQVLIVASIGSYAAAQVQPMQTPLSITKPRDRTVRMDCKVEISNFENTNIHWYRQRRGEAPEWLLYFQSPTQQSNFDKEKFGVGKTSGKYTCSLAIHKVNSDDTATYYCAYWDPTSSGAYIKVFGSGTKLIVTNTKAKLNPQKVQILSPTTQDGNGTYVCLFEDFFPNVINVTWEGPDADKNAIRGEIWPSGDDQNSYSMSSWLTIDDPDQMYNCTYKHESGKDSVPLQSQAPNAPDNQIVPCVNRVENGTTLSTDYDFTESLTHTTAYFVYILLLLKSTMYYVIVLFFMYRMKSSSKRHGKKP